MAPKRKAEEAGIVQPPAGPETEQQPQTENESEDEEAGLTEYEKMRLQLIARNRARLMALGIPVALHELQQLAPSKPVPRPRVPRVKREPAEPTRKSSRLVERETGKPLEEKPDEAASELAMALLDNECPRCGKRLTRGHREHLARCGGVREQAALGLTNEEIEAQAEEYKKREKAKLRQLELSGLVDFTSEQATFIVIGSTGNHYTVKLSNAKRSCECMDYRFRRHDCKHIKLILGALGIAEQPNDWKQAVERMFHKHATEHTEDAAAGGAGAERPSTRAAQQSRKQKGRAKKAADAGQTAANEGVEGPGADGQGRAGDVDHPAEPGEAVKVEETDQAPGSAKPHVGSAQEERLGASSRRRGKSASKGDDAAAANQGQNSLAMKFM